MNPGGSVKDRAAKYMVLDAEEQGRLKPGGVIVEGTAGNTGIGLALVGNARGYRTVVTLPDTQSREKMDALRLVGAELRTVPAVPYSDPANGDGHYRSTGPEIWTQTGGDVDAFCCAIGTGGTLSGVGRYLKERKPEVAIAVTDALGSCMYHWFAHGRMDRTEGGSISEGIGQGRETGNVALAPVDLAFAVPDDEALPVLFDLLAHEGLCPGGSSGINVAGAMRLARHLGPGHTIVTVLCDFGQRYQSKLWNVEFLRGKGLPVPPWLAQG